MLKRKSFKVFGILLSICMVAAIVGGCASQNDAGAAPTAAPAETATADTTAPTAETAAEEPFEVSMMVPLYGVEPVSDESVILKRIEEYTNTKLDIDWVPRANFNDRLSAQLASGTLPMIVTIKDNKETAIVNAIRGGAFWDIGPYLGQFDNLKNLNEGTLKNLMVDGNIYSLYGERELTRNCYIVRSDWLRNLGLSMPTSVEEMLEVAKAFTFDDPDGNGNDDTYGILTNKAVQINQYGVFGMDFLSVAMGAPNGYGENEEGKLYPSYFFDEYVTALDFFRQSYADGTLNPDFSLIEESVKFENYLAGKGGIIFLGNTRDAYNRVVSVMNQDYPDSEAEFDIFSMVEAPDGNMYSFAGTGFSGTFSFSHSSIEDEETLLKVLDFEDKLIDPEMQNIFDWGIEGVHHTVNADGTASFISDDVRTQFASELGDLNQIKLLFLDTRLGVQDPILSKAIELNAEMLPHAVLNPTLSLISDTYTQRSADLDTMLYDASVKYVLGEIDRDGLAAVGEEWLRLGGEQVVEEYTAAYGAAR